MAILTLIYIQQMSETGSHNGTKPSLNMRSTQFLPDLKQIVLSRDKACVQQLNPALSRYPHNLLKRNQRQT